MLNDRVQKCVLRGNADFARADLYVFDVLLIDLISILRERDAAAVVEALNVRARYADVDAADHHVALLLGIDDRFMHAFHRRLEIDDLAFTHAARRCLTDAKNFDRSVGPAFSHDYANFRGPNLKTNQQITARHYSLSFLTR